MHKIEISRRQFTAIASVLKNLVVLAVAWSLALAPSAAMAQGKTQPKKAAPKAAVSAETQVPQRESDEQRPRQGGPREGIKIHGEWVLEIRNPDGSLVTHREFHNAVFGQGLVVSVLGRNSSAGYWALGFDGGTNDGGCGPGFDCIILESGNASLFQAAVVVGSGIQFGFGGGPSLQLKGSGTATSAGTIQRVSSWLGVCPSSTAPAAPCPLLIPSPSIVFSEAFAPAAFPATSVTKGQIVQLTVTFTIS